MECKEVQESLSLYLDRELSAEESSLVQSHLDDCSVCREELAALQEIISQLSSLEEVNPPASFRRELYVKLKENIAQEAKVKKKGRVTQGLLAKFKAWRRHTVFYPVAISLLLLIIFVPIFLQGTHLRSKFMEDSSEPDMMSYRVGVEQNSVNQENVTKSIAPEAMTMTTTQNVVKQSVEESKSAIKPMERKLIKNAELHLWVDDYNSVVEALKSKASALDGYITNETVNVLIHLGAKVLSEVMPQFRFDEFLRGTRFRCCNCLYQNVTEEYIDVESRLNVMRTKEERLLDILTSRVSPVMFCCRNEWLIRAQLESLEGRLRYLSNQTEFSIFNLTIEQVSLQPNRFRLGV